MSLLMDALKRAEKARQAQAEKDTPDKGMSASRLDLNAVEVDRTEGKPRTKASSESPSSSAPDPTTTNFSLSDDFKASEEVSPAKPRGVGPASENESEKLGPFSLVRDDELSLEDTGEMLPVVREAEKSLNEYFEDSDSDSAARPGLADTGENADATTLKRQATGDNDSQAKSAAQSVFTAKAPAVARYKRNRTLMIALPLLLLGVIGISVLLFWKELERTFFGPPPILAQRSPQLTEIAPPTASEPAVVAEPIKLAAAAEAANSSRQLAEQAGSSELTGSLNSPSETTADSAEAAAAPGDVRPVEGRSMAVTAAPAALEDSAGADASPAAAPAQRKTVPRSPAAIARPFDGAAQNGIRISRRSKPDEVHAGISAAYRAFQRGDDAAARALYAEVNRQHPNNRNALLGLGAVAVRGGHYAEAIGHYARLLSINPRDPIAGAALINLNQRVPAGEGESHLKRLLAEDPDQPFLHFSLGNLFARRGRWAEAQRAYFDAYRRDGNNADFAFNLAVSLDQLGQSATALTYYQRALMLASKSPASFEPRAARMRIDRLTGGGQE